MKTNTQNTITTVESAVIAAKCRKGPAYDTTKKGAYWLGMNQTTRRAGGDGIGQSSADVTFSLQLRHFRDGTVTAVVERHSYHQNHGKKNSYTPVPEVLGCQTSEDVMVALKGANCDESVLSDYWEPHLTEALATLGIPAALPAPDEV